MHDEGPAADQPPIRGKDAERTQKRLEYLGLSYHSAYMKSNQPPDL